MTKTSFAFCVLSVCVPAVLSWSAAQAQAVNQTQSVDKVDFDLYPNPAFKQCLGPNPQAHVQVRRGDLNDKLTISISGIHPGLQFDLFTVQRSNLDPNGNVDPNFKGSFGLAWYQTDLQADNSGSGRVTIQTILLDQIFGLQLLTPPLCA